MNGLDSSAWGALHFSAFLMGLSKTGFPGLGTLAIPLIAGTLPAKASTGIVLPMLICGDFFAVFLYRWSACWPSILAVAPWTAVGIGIGYVTLGRISDSALKPLIGGIILLMLGISGWNSLRKKEISLQGIWFPAFIGIFAGFTTMMANAAGPVMMIYFLTLRMPKKVFIGTAAWYFFLFNWFKVPFSAHLGLINAASLQLNLRMLPALALGACAGFFLLTRISEKIFYRIIMLLTIIAACNLFL
ncbi:MAG: sulfite exporter TauE/SafE family protein [Candidatus Ratteibacteria bacterium]|jgi:uncharacterized membrane protein YfcA